MVDTSQLSELVQNPNETLAAEYKEWLDLSDALCRASLARHIAAIANHGGGFIVFGFDDAMRPTGASPFPSYDRDQIGAIVVKYLEPAFHCDVHRIVSSTGVEHTVVAVPPHGGAPICARAGGPEKNGRSQGIEKGTYYIRKPKPESAPILSAAEWAPLIRRCVMHDRASIMGMIDAAIRGAGGHSILPREDGLRSWHDAAQQAFVQDVAAHGAPPSMTTSNWQLSYAIDAGGERLVLNDMPEVLRQVNLEVKAFISTGWSLFFPFTRPGIAPYFSTDPTAGTGDEEFVETSLLRDDQGPRLHHADFWRVSQRGLATIVCDFEEDRAELSQHLRVQPGSWFNPVSMVLRVAECVYHARCLASRFAAPLDVTFRSEWRGLSGRRPLDVENGWIAGQNAGQDHRVANGSWPVASLANEWPAIVAELVGPTCRVFGLERVINADWILAYKRKWPRVA